MGSDEFIASTNLREVGEGRDSLVQNLQSYFLATLLGGYGEEIPDRANGRATLTNEASDITLVQ